MKGKEDDDCLFLENVLDKLYEFEDGPASQRKLKSQKKNKRKRCEEEEEEEELPAVTNTCSDSENNREDDGAEQQPPSTEQTGRQQHGELRNSPTRMWWIYPPMTDLASSNQARGIQIICHINVIYVIALEPICPQLITCVYVFKCVPSYSDPAIERVSHVKVVTFQDPRKIPRTKQITAPSKIPALQKKTEENESDQLEELNLEKTRLEVHRFGITGYKKEQQRVFEQDRAVMLGARPPKKDYVNYKMLQQGIQDKKQKAKEEVHSDLKKKKKTKNPRTKKRRVSSTSGSGSAPSGQVGRFKNGMLVLNSKDIQKVKGNKRHK
ncbi:hypothetical protein EYF80_040661 [Liparis tanakae]|uniref:Uncharacterized protein n=1 Tax=Liparis tanakae TaxID=230148 RepID=A0A4Z2G6H6_9TELE|nr:hypothetical protein EYF80_040661 [Liparis tanakae]